MKASTPPSERFWAKVAVRGPDECWNWTAGVFHDGYGSIGRGGRYGSHIRSHRLSWEMANGAIPAGRLVLHRCDNRRCVNPNHLFLGSHSDNMADMVAKGRSPQQQKTHCAHGHEFSVENTYVHRRGRYCRTCNRNAQAAILARSKKARGQQVQS